jgi:hypothetical protein
MRDSLSRSSVLLYALALASVVAACGDGGGHRPGALPPADAGYSCVDADEDGYGVDCAAGDDCDDTDPTVTDQCFSCLDNAIQFGCACEPQVGVQCVPPPIRHPEGLFICREGTRYCRDGLWTACEPLGVYMLVPGT